LELELAECRAWLERHIGKLSEAEAQAFRALDQEELTRKEAAEKLGRPEGTLATQAVRARTKPTDSIRDSERAFEAGERRRPGR
jgi:DNA-directed RNA polymerase specialized sigma24 family protein